MIALDDECFALGWFQVFVVMQYFGYRGTPGRIGKSHGGLIFSPKPNEIRGVLVRISADLRSRYSLSYYPPDKTPGWRRIQGNVSQSPGNVNLRYQQRYLIR